MNTSQLAQAHADTPAAALPTATLLVTTGCHYCEDAHGELSARAQRGELELVVVPIESEQGQALQTAHRPGMFPLVLLDGKPFSNRPAASTQARPCSRKPRGPLGIFSSIASSCCAPVLVGVMTLSAQ